MNIANGRKHNYETNNVSQVRDDLIGRTRIASGSRGRPAHAPSAPLPLHHQVALGPRAAVALMVQGLRAHLPGTTPVDGKIDTVHGHENATSGSLYGNNMFKGFFVIDAAIFCFFPKATIKKL